MAIILARKKIKMQVIALVFLMAITGTIGYYSFIQGGLNFRFLGYDFNKAARLQITEVDNRYGSIDEFINRCDFIYQIRDSNLQNSEGNLVTPALCYSANPNANYKVALWGDSYAQMLTFGLIKNLPSQWELLQLSSRGCQVSIFEVTPSAHDYCKQSNYFALKTIAKLSPDVVVISQNSTLNQQNIDLISDKLHSLGVKKIIYVDKPPKWKSELPKLVFRKAVDIHSLRNSSQLHSDTIDQVNREDRLVFSARDRYINTAKFFCQIDGCLLGVGPQLENSITTLDGEHLTPAASNYFAKSILVDMITQ